MSERYPVPAAPTRCDLEVSRSRFLASLTVASTVAEAEAHVAAVSAEFADATHNCWAYVVGPPGSTAQVGMSDDGEPHGTAGRPMLNALLHGGLGDVAVVVTRWFGGTKLGKGGLVRAYGGAVVEALERVERGERITWRHVTLDVPYADVDAVERLFDAHEVERLAVEYAERVRQELRMPEEHRDAFGAAVRDATSGRAVVG